MKCSFLVFESMPCCVAQMCGLCSRKDQHVFSQLFFSHMKSISGSSPEQSLVLDVQPPYLPFWKGWAPFTDQQCSHLDNTHTKKFPLTNLYENIKKKKLHCHAINRRGFRSNRWSCFILLILLVWFPWTAVSYLPNFCFEVCFCNSKEFQRYCWQVWLWWQHFAAGG